MNTNNQQIIHAQTNLMDSPIGGKVEEARLERQEKPPQAAEAEQDAEGFNRQHAFTLGCEEKRLIVFPFLEKLVDWRGRVDWDAKTRAFAESEHGTAVKLLERTVFGMDDMALTTATVEFPKEEVALRLMNVRRSWRRS